MSLNLSFLTDSIAHQMIAGEYAKGDVESFPADTIEKQEALKYWRMPLHSDQETISQEAFLVKKYAAEIEMIRKHIWHVHMERVLKSKKTFLATRFDMVFDALVSISTVTKRTIIGIACIISGLTSVFFLFLSLPNPVFGVLFCAFSVCLLTAGVYLLISARRASI